MLRHLTARSVQRAFTLRLGSGPEVTVNADAEGILRAPPSQRGDPIETGPQIEEAFPDVAEGLLSRYPDQIEDLRPKPAPEVEPEVSPAVEPEMPPAPADVTAPDPQPAPEPAPDPQPATEAEPAAEAAPAWPATDTKESDG